MIHTKRGVRDGEVTLYFFVFVAAPTTGKRRRKMPKRGNRNMTYLARRLSRMKPRF
jgi:hypothetical protein